ncbi:MAG: hypothetical protein LBU87_05865 [Lactobacillales bacterium]|jgi:hypothetical protein|nr:hypothetical protein [Lactobacillales bacterium]
MSGVEVKKEENTAPKANIKEFIKACMDNTTDFEQLDSKQLSPEQSDFLFSKKAEFLTLTTYALNDKFVKRSSLSREEKGMIYSKMGFLAVIPLSLHLEEESKTRQAVSEGKIKIPPVLIIAAHKALRHMANLNHPLACFEYASFLNSQLNGSNHMMKLHEIDDYLKKAESVSMKLGYNEKTGADDVSFQMAVSRMRLSIGIRRDRIGVNRPAPELSV